MSDTLVLQPRRIEARIMDFAKPFYWSVRRELWENRFILVAPLVMAGIVLIAFLLSAPYRLNDAMKLPQALQREIIEKPYDLAAFAMLVAGFLIGAFYSLDALYGERRDRSVLFWKSLPVSDLTVVLSKAAVPIIVLPAVIYVVTVATQLLMLLLNCLLLMPDTHKAALLWTHVGLFNKAAWFSYGLTSMALWYAPIFAWFLMVSAWARRAPLLWAVMPFVLMGAANRIACSHPIVEEFLRYRFIGWYGVAFAFRPQGNKLGLPVAIDPLKFLTTPGFWGGLLFALAFLIVATRLRRYRGPV